MLKIESDAAHNSIQMDADFSEYTKGDFIAGATVELLATCLAAITASVDESLKIMAARATSKEQIDELSAWVNDLMIKQVQSITPEQVDMFRKAVAEGTQKEGYSK